MLRYIRINYNYSLTSEIGRDVLPLMYAKIYMKRGFVLTKSTILSSEGITIRHFEQGDMPLLGELYNSVTSRNAVFWWVGDEENWENVYCAFENGKMVAKGQVEIINIVPPGRSKESRHSIYLNLKTIPEREEDYDLLESMYRTLLLRALELKETLSTAYKTTLCVGNNASEIANTQFLKKKRASVNTTAYLK